MNSETPSFISSENQVVLTPLAKTYILAILVGVHILITLFFCESGHLLIDELTYHRMAKAFAKNGTLSIWNGYVEFPSVELIPMFTHPFQGKLVPQYPYLYPILCAPFYLAFGFYGLFLINSIAFLGVVYLTYSLARRLSDNEDIALNACFILVFATFAWEYSQAAWPHALSLLFVIGSVLPAVRAYYAPSIGQAIALGFLAGLVAGFGCGVRLDCIIVLPCIFLPFFFTRPWKPWHAAAVLCGAFPGLAALTFTNYWKFGIWNPFTYGYSSGIISGPPWKLVAGILALMLLAWIVTRSHITKLIQQRKGIALLVLVGMVGAIVTIPESRALLWRLIDGFLTMVVDLSRYGLERPLPGGVRTSGGGVSYIEAQKKALLQSLPYLPVLLIPLAHIFKKKENRAYLAMLFLVPLFSIGLFSYIPFHGGLCLNSRYFCFVLPFTSILCAYAWADVSRSYKPRHPVHLAIATAFVAATVYFVLSKWLFTGLNQQEFHQLRVPLVMSVFLFFMAVCSIWGSQNLSRRMSSFLWVGLIFAFVWSGVVAFFYDFPQHRAQRQRNDEVGSITANLVQPNSIVFLTIYPDSFANLIDKDKIRIARPREDRFRDFPALLQFHLDRGRPAYGVFMLREWNALLKGPLKNHVVHPIWSFKGGSSKKLEIISLGPYNKVPVQDLQRGVMLGRIDRPSSEQRPENDLKPSSDPKSKPAD